MAEVVVTSREVAWKLCYLVSNGKHDGMQPDRREETARTRLAGAREESRHPDRYHVHRIETVTTSELLDW